MDNADTAMRDIMHHFSMFVNQNWWLEQATPDNVDLMNMQLHHRFGSQAYQAVASPERTYNVIHRFPDFDISVQVEDHGTVTIRGSVKNRASFDSPEVKSAMKAAQF